MKFINETVQKHNFKKIRIMMGRSIRSLNINIQRKCSKEKSSWSPFMLWYLNDVILGQKGWKPFVHRQQRRRRYRSLGVSKEWEMKGQQKCKFLQQPIMKYWKYRRLKGMCQKAKGRNRHFNPFSVFENISKEKLSFKYPFINPSD